MSYKMQQVAIKALNKKTTNHNKEQDLIQIKNEIEILSSLNHPNIIKLYSVKQTNLYYYLVLEYSSQGDLLYYLKKHNYHISLESSILIFFQIVNAISYLNRKGIIHRDIKLDNFTISENNVVKLIDFGFSVKLENKDKSIINERNKNDIDDKDRNCFTDFLSEIKENKNEINDVCINNNILDTESSYSNDISNEDINIDNDLTHSEINTKNSLVINNMLRDFPGTLQYASPEIVVGENYNGMISDVWSLGVVFYFLIFGKLPFNDENKERLVRKIMLGIISDISIDFHNLLNNKNIREGNNYNDYCCKDNYYYTDNNGAMHDKLKNEKFHNKNIANIDNNSDYASNRFYYTSNINNSYISDLQKLFDGIFRISPNKRISLDDIINSKVFDVVYINLNNAYYTNVYYKINMLNMLNQERRRFIDNNNLAILRNNNYNHNNLIQYNKISGYKNKRKLYYYSLGYLSIKQILLNKDLLISLIEIVNFKSKDSFSYTKQKQLLSSFNDRSKKTRFKFISNSDSYIMLLIKEAYSILAAMPLEIKAIIPFSKDDDKTENEVGGDENNNNVLGKKHFHSNSLNNKLVSNCRTASISSKISNLLGNEFNLYNNDLEDKCQETRVRVFSPNIIVRSCTKKKKEEITFISNNLNIQRKCNDAKHISSNIAEENKLTNFISNSSNIAESDVKDINDTKNTKDTQVKLNRRANNNNIKHISNIVEVISEDIEKELEITTDNFLVSKTKGKLNLNNDIADINSTRKNNKKCKNTASLIVATENKKMNKNIYLEDYLASNNELEKNNNDNKDNRNKKNKNKTTSYYLRPLSSNKTNSHKQFNKITNNKQNPFIAKTRYSRNKINYYSNGNKEKSLILINKTENTIKLRKNNTLENNIKNRINRVVNIYSKEKIIYKTDNINNIIKRTYSSNQSKEKKITNKTFKESRIYSVQSNIDKGFNGKKNSKENYSRSSSTNSSKNKYQLQNKLPNNIDNNANNYVNNTHNKIVSLKININPKFKYNNSENTTCYNKLKIRNSNRNSIGNLRSIIHNTDNMKNSNRNITYSYKEKEDDVISIKRNINDKLILKSKLNHNNNYCSKKMEIEIMNIKSNSNSLKKNLSLGKDSNNNKDIINSGAQNILTKKLIKTPFNFLEYTNSRVLHQKEKPPKTINSNNQSSNSNFSENNALNVNLNLKHNENIRNSNESKSKKHSKITNINIYNYYINTNETNNSNRNINYNINKIKHSEQSKTKDTDKSKNSRKSLSKKSKLKCGNRSNTKNTNKTINTNSSDKTVIVTESFLTKNFNYIKQKDANNNYNAIKHNSSSNKYNNNKYRKSQEKSKLNSIKGIINIRCLSNNNNDMINENKKTKEINVGENAFLSFTKIKKTNYCSFNNDTSKVTINKNNVINKSTTSKSKNRKSNYNNKFNKEREKEHFFNNKRALSPLSICSSNIKNNNNKDSISSSSLEANNNDIDSNKVDGRIPLINNLNKNSLNNNYNNSNVMKKHNNNMNIQSIINEVTNSYNNKNIHKYKSNKIDSSSNNKKYYNKINDNNRNIKNKKLNTINQACSSYISQNASINNTKIYSNNYSTNNLPKQLPIKTNTTTNKNNNINDTFFYRNPNSSYNRYSIQSNYSNDAGVFNASNILSTNSNMTNVINSNFNNINTISNVVDINTFDLNREFRKVNIKDYKEIYKIKQTKKMDINTYKTLVKERYGLSELIGGNRKVNIKYNKDKSNLNNDVISSHKSKNSSYIFDLYNKSKYEMLCETNKKFLYKQNSKENDIYNFYDNDCDYNSRVPSPGFINQPLSTKSKYNIDLDIYDINSLAAKNK